MPAILFAGLPAAGKSSLAQAVARKLRAHILSKDLVREAAFGPAHVAYTAAQDDLVQEWLFAAARSLWATQPDLWVIFDGRTYSLAEHRQAVARICAGQQQRLVQVYCHCSPETARRRLQAPHVAKNRTWQLWQDLAAQFEPLATPDVIVDSERPMAENMAKVMACLGAVE